MKYAKLSICVVVLVACLAASANAALIHRYSFTSDASDSVGSIDGTLAGDYGGAYIQDGNVLMRGNLNRYVDFGSAMGAELATLHNSTLEFWSTTWDDCNIYGNLFSSSNGQGAAAGETFLWSGTNTRTGVTFCLNNSTGDNVVGMPYDENYANAVKDGVQHHIVFTIQETADGDNATGCVYFDGVLAGTNTNLLYTLSDLGAHSINRLGWSNFGELFSGDVNEFRIYDTALTQDQVTASLAAGPDALVPEPGTLALLATGLLGLLAYAWRKRK